MPEELWNKVQEELKTKAVTARGIRKEREEYYLRGRLYDFQGTRYSPTYTNKKGRRYRYYISQNLLQGDDHPKQLIARIPIFEIESRVEKGIRDQLCNGNHAALLFALDWESDQILLRQIAKKQDLIPAKRLLMESVEKVVVGVDTITVQFKVKALLRLLADLADVHIPSQEEISDIHEISLSYVPRKANYGAVLIEPIDERNSVKPADPFDLPPTELKNLVRGHIWRDEHFKGKTIRQIAVREKFSEGFVAKCILKTFDLV